jgi:gliding motility-associated-like protein
VQFQSISAPANDTLPLVFWQWIFGDGNSSILENPEHSFDNDGSFQVQLTITDTLGCTAAATIDVEVIGNIVIPNVITPNGDGQNDVFQIQNLDLYPPASLTIYNRWGREELQTTSYANNWTPDEPADGVYFYILRLQDGRTFTGNLIALNSGR